MLVDLLRRFGAVEVLSDDVDDAGAHKVTVRVLDEKLWFKTLPAFLKTANGDAEFGLEVHKVFHVVESGDVAFTWVVIFWGEEADVVPLLVPVLSRKAVAPPSFALGKRSQAGSTPAPARAPSPATPPAEEDDDAPLPDVVLGRAREGVHRVEFVRTLANGTEEYRVPLPHVRRNRFEGNPHEVINIESGRGRFKAVAQGRGEAEFSARKAENL